MQRIKFWNNFSPLQRRAIMLVGASLFVGFFLSRGTAPFTAPFVTVWREFVSASPAFRIAMPEYPRHLVQDTALPSLGITVRKGMFISEDNEGHQYVLAVASYPLRTPMFSIEHIVDAELTALFSRTDYTVDTKTNAMGADFSAVRFDGGPSIKGKVVVDGQNVYVLSLSAPSSPLSNALYQQFISSFKQ